MIKTLQYVFVKTNIKTYQSEQIGTHPFKIFHPSTKRIKTLRRFTFSAETEHSEILFGFSTVITDLRFISENKTMASKYYICKYIAFFVVWTHG